MGEAAGEADFATRLVDDTGDVDEGEWNNEPKTENEMSSGGFKVPVNKAMEELKFSRVKKVEDGRVTDKRAWVISPGIVRLPSMTETDEPARQAWAISGEFTKTVRPLVAEQ